MTRAQLRRIILKHRGASARLARDLGLKPVTISNWLHDRFESDKIEAAALARVEELLEKDGQKRATEERIRQKLAAAQGSAA